MICDILAYKTYCGIARSYGYDGFLRLETIKANEPTGQTVQDYTYSYRPSGNIAAITKADGRASDGTTTYGYDQLYRLTSASGPESTEAYTYDPLGNRRTSLGVTGSWVYNANNELLSYGTTTIQYDLNGNTTQKTGPDGVVWTYLWDLENRLTEVKKDGVTVATYVYDPFGRRLTKTVYENGTPTTTHFAYADEGLVAEYDATGTVTKAYGYYPNGTWTTNPLYLWTTEATPTGEYYWYLNDHLGTPKALTDELGQLVWTATAEAFGKTTVAAGSAITNNLRFPGQYEDGESGEAYNWNRYYQAYSGRYATKDPIGLRGGVNLYGFVRNNPLRFIDPDGKAYFATRPLNALIEGGGDILQFLMPSWGLGWDLLNIALVHEHLFFEDGRGNPSNTGFFQKGIAEEAPEMMSNYTRRDGGYKDCVMRKAYKHVLISQEFAGGTYNWFFHNCQHYAATLRLVYRRLVLEGYDCSESEEPEKCH